MAELDQMIERIQEEVKAVSERADLPDGFLELKEIKDGRSLWIVEPVSKSCSKMVFSIMTKGRKGQKYFSVAVKISILSKIPPPETAEVVMQESDAPNCRLNFMQGDTEIIPYLHDLILYYVEHFEPSDKFGCCHRYKECSAEKKCIHPDPFYAKACWYRKNLEAGKVFY